MHEKPMTMEPYKKDPNKFIPEGAIAFFTLLLLLGFLIWVGVYMIYIVNI